MFNKPISILENQLAKGKKSGLNLMTGVGSLAGAAAGTDIGYISGSNSMSIGSPNDPDYLSDKGRNIKMGIGAIAGAALGGYGARKGISSFINKRLDGLVDMRVSLLTVGPDYKGKLGEGALGSLTKDDLNSTISRSRYFKVEDFGEKSPFYMRNNSKFMEKSYPYERKLGANGIEPDSNIMIDLTVKMKKRNAIGDTFKDKDKLLDRLDLAGGENTIHSVRRVRDSSIAVDMNTTI